ncbi:iron(III) transport system permease protein [Halobiforma haloterrestris]|uniref:Iron(III) transport system permease protein n=1 Tax=Natronobacterium haloterrestre TaxID=148448 RepID=A0A1I1E6J4_NATHA|nr:iron ABC transporter permease [Halobiforma haloterrestris]SFB82825.1 iron(III) transport system permease protein [Halobiforma haloterrestris]
MKSLLSVRRYTSNDELPLGLTLLSGAIAAAMLFPLTWLLVEATRVDTGRAWEMFVRTETLEILTNSLLLMAAVTLFSVLLGVPLAWLTVQTDLPFRRFWSVVVALPLVVPSYIGAFAFVSAFGPRGEFQSILEPLGVEQLPEIYGLSGATLVITLYTYPYVYLTTRAALLSFDTTLLDAARTLNHDTWTAFRRVTLPQIRPAVVAGALLAALYSVSDFGTPAIMQLPVFTRQIYVEFNAWNRDYASLLSLQLLAIVLVVLALEWRVRRGDSSRGGGGGEGTGGGPVVELGAWRWPAMALPAAVTGIALAVPLWILGLWLVTADPNARPELAFELEYAMNSVLVAGAAALVAVLAALPVAYFAARNDSLVSTVLERATYVGFAVPGIVLGLALVYFATGYESLNLSFAPTLYQTLPLLIFAYVVRFMPQAVGSIRTTTLQVDPKLVEAARTLGETPTRTFRKITLPLIAPGMTAGAALVFLTTMKELPATLFLRPTGFDTLVTVIWRAQEAAYFQYAAIPALMLLVVSGLSMVVLLSQGGREGL